MKSMNSTTKDSTIKTGEMLGAISRSGYLLESQISELLTSMKFFVETNQSIQDPSTGKSREIDLLAEYYEYQENNNGVLAKIKFVFEAKNNPYPMVMITELKPTPNIEPWEAFREVITETENSKRLSIDDRFFGKLNGYDVGGIFTQYCSFKRKKDSGNNSELMAWHPDEFHEALMKIVQYCDDQVESWEDRTVGKWFRDILYLPVLVLGGSLYELTFDKKGKHRLKKVETSKLWYNYHWKDEYKSVLIWVVTQKGLSKFITNMIKVEREIEQEMITIIAKHKSSQ
jgi:hypothetical protein